MKRVAIQGIKGAFHEVAAKKYFEHEEIEIIGEKNFEDVVQSVINGNSDFWVIAIENTIAGTIYPNLNLLKDKPVDICGEIFIRIKQNLAVLPWTKIEDLKEVHSHYMALNQTRDFFHHYPHIQLINAEDTALAMQQVSTLKDKTIWAVGSELAAEMYGLEIIGEGIETNKKNYTRFFIIQPQKEEKKSDFNKVSLSFVLSHHVGSLVQILAVISAYGMDLTKIESLPILWEPLNYRFYIDITFEDIEKYREMISAIHPLLKELHILGEYQAWETSRTQIHQEEN